MRLGDKLSLIQKKPEIWLVTFRKNGNRVKTPMWFIIQNNRIYLLTNKNTKKIKYILRDPHVEIWLNEEENVKLSGVARLIFPQNSLFPVLAKKLWERHPTFYGPFEKRYQHWSLNAVIIEVHVSDE